MTSSSSSSSSSLLRKDVWFRLLPPALVSQDDDKDDDILLDHVRTTTLLNDDDNDENDDDDDERKLQVLYRLRTCRCPKTTTEDNIIICSNSQLLEHIRTLIEEYQKKFYSKKKHITAASRCCLCRQDDERHNFVVYTYIEYNDRSNCACGTWTSEWNICLQDDDEKSCELYGKIQFHAYNYDEGDGNNNNIQTRVCRTVKKRTVSVQEEHVHSLVAQFEHNTSMNYEQQLSKAIVDRNIVQLEHEFYNDTKTMLNDNIALRPLRGILPLTKTKFKWDIVATQKNAMLLNTARGKKKSV